MPKRIQRKRTKGFKMTEGAIYVGRPTKWGNPFWHTAKFHGIEKSLELYENLARGCWSPILVVNIPTADQIYDDQQGWLKRIGCHPLEAMRSELKGKDLACWCALDKPCHADILLRLANPPTIEEMSGFIPNFTEGMSLKEYMERIND